MSDDWHSNRIFQGMSRGVAGRCPHCGAQSLFSSYLKIVPRCPGCQHLLEQYRSDDGPAYFTILLVGHLVVGPLLFLDIILTWPIGWLMALILPSVVGLCLILLPRVKGAFVGLQWAIGDKSAA